MFSVKIFIFLALSALSSASAKKQGRIFGGKNAKKGEIPHQVSLRLKEKDESKGFGNGHICGGSLLRDDVVLTAAHCFFNNGKMYKASNLNVVMGSVHKRDQSHSFVSEILDFKVHEHYKDDDTYENDIALIRLQCTFPMNFRTRFTLYPIKMAAEAFPVGTKCKVSGWGMMENNKFPDKLQVAHVEIMDFNKCKQSYTSIGDQLKPGMFCAGSIAGGNDACTEDGGGPLECNGQLFGVVSFGKGCANKEYPGVYSSLPFFKNWIEENIKTLGAKLP